MFYAKLRSENLVKESCSLLFICALGKCELRDENLLRLGEHALFTSRESTIEIATVEIAYNFCDLDDVSGCKLFEVCLIAT
jgi:hypothetical protein